MIPVPTLVVGAQSTLGGAQLSIVGARAPTKVYKSTPMPLPTTLAALQRSGKASQSADVTMVCLQRASNPACRVESCVPWESAPRGGYSSLVFKPRQWTRDATLLLRGFLSANFKKKNLRGESCTAAPSNFFMPDGASCAQLLKKYGVMSGHGAMTS